MSGILDSTTTEIARPPFSHTVVLSALTAGGLGVAFLAQWYTVFILGPKRPKTETAVTLAPVASTTGGGLWASYNSITVWHGEDADSGNPGLVKFQIRPNPLAR